MRWLMALIKCPECGKEISDKAPDTLILELNDSRAPTKMTFVRK